ncbi:MAG: hypothetical protein AAGF73_18815 [Actinomycetota bacterium]
MSRDRASTVVRRAASVGVPNLIEVLLAAWLVATAASQHANRNFDRVRSNPWTMTLLPDWRFFAPRPAIHDYRVMYRWVDDAGEPSAWQDAAEIAPRRLAQALWFPERRTQKGLFDACTELTKAVGLDPDRLHRSVAYRLVRDYVERRISQRVPEPPRGFQFVVVADPGYDTNDTPDYLFASRFEPWRTDA